jgi:ABC-type nitrate/sulfonate/bicarbonate transport system substrate-binding protein
MKKWSYAAAALIVILPVAFFITRQKKEPPQADKIRVGYNTESLTNASVIVAYEKKYFEKNGLSAEMVPLKGGKEVRQALAAGQVDIGLGGFTNFMTAMAAGAPMKFIAASASSPSYVFVRPGENVKNFQDLYGKTICSGAAGINDIIFRIAMEKEGIDVEKMKFVDIEREFQVPALMEKKAMDAVVVSDQDTEMLLKAGAVVLPEWESKGYVEFAEPRNSVAVNTDYLAKNEKTVENFLDACADAHRLIGSNPDEAARLLADHIRKGSGGAVDHSPEVIAEKWKNKDTVNMIWQDPSDTMELAKKAKDMGLIDKELTLSDVYDLRFENKLKAIQSEIYGTSD